MKELLIEVKQLSKSFQKQREKSILNNINIKINRGDVYGIMGLSGAGKTTLMRCLAGLEKPTEGEVSFLNQPFSVLSEREMQAVRKDFGMIFQHFNLFSSRTVADNIAFPMEIFHSKKETINRRVDELLSLVHLSNKKNHYPSQLSGGEKQRVGTARALANQPQVLLCDEPTSALDSQTSHSILELLHNLNRQLGLTIVIITHHLKVIKQICNRVAVLAEGNIIEEGFVGELLKAPKHPFTKKLINYEV